MPVLQNCKMVQNCSYTRHENATIYNNIMITLKNYLFCRISSGQMNECNRNKRTTDPAPQRPVSDRPYETLRVPDTLSATYDNQVVPKDTTDEENYTDPSGYIVII